MSFKEKYTKYKGKYTKLKNNIQQVGGCPGSDDPVLKNTIIASGTFDNDTKHYQIKKHATKHLESMNVSCITPERTINHYVRKALEYGKVSDGSNPIDFFNMYEGRSNIDLFNTNNQGINYNITGIWDSGRQTFTVFQFCKMDMVSKQCTYE